MKSVKGAEWGDYDYDGNRVKKRKKGKKGKKGEKDAKGPTPPAGGVAGGAGGPGGTGETVLTGSNETDVWIWKGIGIWGGNSKLEEGGEWKLDDEDEKKEKSKKKKGKKGKGIGGKGGAGGKGIGRFIKKRVILRDTDRSRSNGGTKNKSLKNSVILYVI